jgi:hypothetical protein
MNEIDALRLAVTVLALGPEAVSMPNLSGDPVRQQFYNEVREAMRIARRYANEDLVASHVMTNTEIIEKLRAGLQTRRRST